MGWDLSVIDAGPRGGGIPTGDVGFHLNAAESVLSATPAAAAYVVVPASPAVVWAGAVTIFLRFPDEATAKRVLADYWQDSTAGA